MLSINEQGRRNGRRWRQFVLKPFGSNCMKVPMEGTERSMIAGQVFEWGPRDVVVVPSWHRVEHEADGEAAFGGRIAGTPEAGLLLP